MSLGTLAEKIAMVGGRTVLSNVGLVLRLCPLKQTALTRSGSVCVAFAGLGMWFSSSTDPFCVFSGVLV